MAHDKQYWEKRMVSLYNSRDKKDAALNKRMAKEYERVGANINKEIGAYYAKYGKDDVINFRDMSAALSNSERNLLFKDIEAFASKYPQYADLMPVRESVYKLNRLEGLQLSVRQNMLELGAIEQAEFDKHLSTAYNSGYLSGMDGLENPRAFFKVDSLVMQQTLSSKWVDGKNYSDRIWANKEKLINTMNNEIRDGLIRGDSYSSMIKAVRHRTGVGVFDSKRLIFTESAFVLNEANAQAFVDAGIEEYEISAVMDEKTSPTCRHLDGERFRFSERTVGVNAPPFHSFCRTTIIPIENSKKDINSLDQIRNRLNEIDDIMWELEDENYGTMTEDEAADLYEELYQEMNQLKAREKEMRPVVPFKTLDEDDLFSYQTKSNMWYNQLEMREVEAIQDFTDNGYTSTNGFLLEPDSNMYKHPKTREFIEEKINSLDAALAKFELKEDVASYRGVSTKELRYLKENNEFKEFKSTSFDFDVAKKFSNENSSKDTNIVKFNLPKGTKGAFIGDNSKIRGEAEFLLTRNTKYRYEEVDGERIITILLDEE